MTATIYARQGVHRVEFLDEASGWRAVMDLGFGFKGETLGAYFASADAKVGRDTRISQSSPGIPEFERHLQAEDQVGSTAPWSTPWPKRAWPLA